MIKRASVGAGALVLGTALATGIAVATPPHGIALIDNAARGPAVGSATVSITPGTGAFTGSYTVQPGSSSGWRTQPGLSLLAVTEGTLKVVRAKGCAVREYTAPDVAVLPAGTFHVSNAGGAAAKFVGYFDNLKKGSAQPLAAGAEARAPAACASNAYRAASAGISAAEIGSGIFTTIPARKGNHHIAPPQRLTVADGSDVVLLTAKVAAGTSTGWYRHVPGLAIITKGQMDAYEATDSGCAKVEEAHAGDAASHAHHAEHLSFFPKDSEVVVLMWGMGNNRLPQPGLLNFAEGMDWAVMPPAGCTTI